MLETKKILLQSIGFTIKELKKTFLISNIFFLILFGISYLFFLISFGLYFIIKTNQNAILFVFMNSFFVLIIFFILYFILNKIKKVCLLKVMNAELNSKDILFMKFIDSLLDKEYKSSKGMLKKTIRFLLVICFVILIFFFLIGLWLIITNIYLKLFCFALISLTIICYLFFLTRWSFFTDNSKELIISYKLFAKRYSIILSTLIISILPIAILITIFMLIPSFAAKYYLFVLLLSFSINLMFYYNFFVYSFIFLEEHKKE